MFNIKSTDLQSDNQIEELGELSESELKAVVGGGLQKDLKSTTTIGKTLLQGIGKFVRNLEDVSE